MRAIIHASRQRQPRSNRDEEAERSLEAVPPQRPSQRRRTPRLAPPDEQPYLSRLAGAGSLRSELEALLNAAPPDADQNAYRSLILEANVAGKGTASMRVWVWKRLKVRYVLDPDVAEFRAFVDAMRMATRPADRGLVAFLMLARTDRLFREGTLQAVSPHLREPGTLIRPETVDEAIAAMPRGDHSTWSAETVAGLRSHLLSALKDFGILEGGRDKRTCRLHPGPPTTVFAARLGRLEGLTDRGLLRSRWFRLLGLEESETVDLLYTAARERALAFRMQAGIVELSLPEVARR
jgi:hypothetical protein